MKNVTPKMLKNCIFLTADQYTEILRKIFGSDVEVYFESDGISVNHKNGDDIQTDVINIGLAGYFSVTCVTSVHADDWEPTGVWVCYKE